MKQRTFKWYLQVLVTVLVIGFVTFAFWKPLSQLGEHDIAWDFSWLFLAGVAYFVGILFSLTFWWISLRSLGQRPEPIKVIWAYFLGHLAKYVPGKALVVLLRTVLVKGPQCRMEVAAVTVVYETIIYMAVGAVLAASVVLLQGPFGVHLNYWHIAFLVAGLVPLVIPPVFNAIMRRLTAPLRKLPDGTHAPFPALGVKLLTQGVLLQSTCCVFVAISLACVIKSVRPEYDPWPVLPSLVAKLAAATVLGFVIPTPAGIGTREWALLQMLKDDIGEDYAALVPILTRLVWLITECVVVCLLFPIARSKSSTPAQQNTPPVVSS